MIKQPPGFLSFRHKSTGAPQPSSFFPLFSGLILNMRSPVCWSWTAALLFFVFLGELLQLHSRYLRTNYFRHRCNRRFPDVYMPVAAVTTKPPSGLVIFAVQSNCTMTNKAFFFFFSFFFSPTLMDTSQFQSYNQTSSHNLKFNVFFRASLV